MAGYGSPAVVRERIRTADALLVIGSRLGEVTTGGLRDPRPGPALDPRRPRAARGGRRRVAGARAGDPLRRPRVPPRGRRAAQGGGPARGARSRHATATTARTGRPGRPRPRSKATPWDGPGVHPGRIIADLRRLLPDDAILTTDAGAFGGWAARGFRFRRPGTFLGPTSGAMGYGFPAALAAALVHRERRVVALLGRRRHGHVAGRGRDGRARGRARHRDRVRQRAVRDDPGPPGRSEGSPTSPGTDLGPIDFAAAARACGARGVRVDTDAGFEPALRTALAASGPTVIQLALDRRWVSVDQPATA